MQKDFDILYGNILFALQEQMLHDDDPKSLWELVEALTEFSNWIEQRREALVKKQTAYVEEKKYSLAQLRKAWGKGYNDGLKEGGE